MLFFLAFSGSLISPAGDSLKRRPEFVPGNCGRRGNGQDPGGLVVEYGILFPLSLIFSSSSPGSRDAAGSPRRPGEGAASPVTCDSEVLRSI
jgi:hypothetical protein